MSLAFSSEVCAQTPNNLQVLSALLDSLIATVKVPGDSAVDELFVSSLDSGNRANWLFEERLQSRWEATASRTYLSGYARENDGAGRRRWLLEFRPLQLGITYRNGTGAGNLRRGAKVVIYLALLEMPERGVLWSGELRGETSDIVAADAVASLENRTVAFTKGVMQNQRGPGKLLPAFLVTAAAGSIVYLFYSVRSR